MSPRTRTDWPTTTLGLSALLAVFLFWNAGSGLLPGAVSVVGLLLLLFGVACLLVAFALRQDGGEPAETRRSRERR